MIARFQRRYVSLSSAVSGVKWKCLAEDILETLARQLVLASFDGALIPVVGDVEPSEGCCMASLLDAPKRRSVPFGETLTSESEIHLRRWNLKCVQYVRVQTDGCERQGLTGKPKSRVRNGEAGFGRCTSC
jgi:hypothetical protein